MDDLDHRSATRAVYDATAEAYAAAIGTDLNPDFEGPIDRALLAAFADLVAGMDRPVGDLGCGPGRVAAFLTGHGITTVGLDLSESMVHIGQGANAATSFGTADLRRLPLRQGSLAGAVCWYSIIHTAARELPALFAEVARVVVSGGPLLVAFQTGDDERIERADAHGSGFPLVNHRHHVDTVVDGLEIGGFDVQSATVRPSRSSREPTVQAFVLATAR